MATFDHIESVFPDWRYGHPKVLYGLIRSLQPQIVVEVGTYRGYGACYMAQALEDNGAGHLYCIDDFSEATQRPSSPEHWRENLSHAGLLHRATLMVGKSSEVVWPQKVDFAYIDGWHSLAQVAADFTACATCGAEVICLDDTDSTIGPNFFVQLLQADDELWDVARIHRDCGLTICTRRRMVRPNYSQEIPGSPGVVLTDMSDEGVLAHLDEAARITGNDYNNYVVHPKPAKDQS